MATLQDFIKSIVGNIQKNAQASQQRTGYTPQNLLPSLGNYFNPMNPAGDQPGHFAGDFAPMIFGGGPQSLAAAPEEGALTTGAKMAADDTVQAVKDTTANMASQPGGFEAGFAKFPGEEPYTPPQLLDARGDPIKPTSPIPGVKVNANAAASIKNYQNNPSIGMVNTPAEDEALANGIGHPPTPEQGLPKSPPVLNPISAPELSPQAKIDMGFHSQIDNVESLDAAKEGIDLSDPNNPTVKMRDYLTRYGAYDFPSASKVKSQLYDASNPNGMVYKVLNNPQMVDVPELEGAYKDALDAKSTYLPRGSSAQNASSKFVQELLGNGQTLPPNTQVDMGKLFNLKQSASQQLKELGTYEKLKSGAGVDSLNMQERELLSRNEALGSILEKYNPGIKDQMGAYGAVRDALPQYKEIYDEQNPNTPPPPPGREFPGLKGAAKFASTTPGKIAGGAILGGIIVGGLLNNKKGGLPTNPADAFVNSKTDYAQEKGQNRNGQQQQKGLPINTQNANTIPQSGDDIKPLSDKTYGFVNPFQVKGPDGKTPVLLSKSDFNSMNSQLLKEQATAQNNDDYYSTPQTHQALLNATADLKRLNDLNNTIGQDSSIGKSTLWNESTNNEFSKTIKMLQDAQAQPDLKGVLGAPSLFGLGGWNYNDLRKASNGKYSALANNLEDLEHKLGLAPGTLAKDAQTTNVLVSNLQNANFNMLNSYYTELRQNLGDLAPSQPTSSQTTTAAGQNPSISTSLPSAGTDGLAPIGGGLVKPPVNTSITPTVWSAPTLPTLPQ